MAGHNKIASPGEGAGGGGRSFGLFFHRQPFMKYYIGKKQSAPEEM